MQRWLFSVVATVLAYLAVLQLPRVLGDLAYGLGGGADQLVDDAGPLLLLCLGLWVLFGADRPLARPWRLGGVAMVYLGVMLLRYSIEYLQIPQTYKYQPAILISSALVIALGLLFVVGDFDETRLRRWTVFSLLSGAVVCLSIDFLHWFVPPATFKYAPWQSIPVLILSGGILLKCSTDESLLQLLVRWAVGYGIASFGTAILLNYKNFDGGFWSWLFEDLYADAWIAAGTVVVGVAVLVFIAPPFPFRTRRLSLGESRST